MRCMCVQCLVGLLHRTWFIEWEPAVSEALLTMTVSAPECALDLVQIPAAWSTGRGRRGAWERQHQFGGRRVRVPLPSTERVCTAVQRTPNLFWYSLLPTPCVYKEKSPCWELYGPSKLIFLLSDTLEPEKILLSASLSSSPAFN